MKCILHVSVIFDVVHAQVVLLYFCPHVFVYLMWIYKLLF